jgi:hypothetical protein
MRKKARFENGVQEIQIVHDSGFKYLNLISAVIDKVEDAKDIPSVELILTNDKAMFTSYSNWVPGTNNLDCFDLLLTASNNPALSNETFHTLKCVVPGNAYDADAVIEMEFEIG